MAGEHRRGRRPFLANRLGDPAHRGLLDELKVARSWGVPLSKFRGRGTQAITEVERDPSGNVLRTVTTAESAWTDSDRWLAFALHHHEQSSCSECGQPKAIAWHPDSEGWYEAEGITCWACDAIRKDVERSKVGPQVHVLARLTHPDGEARVLDASAIPINALQGPGIG
jgi:hypothetical protein